MYECSETLSYFNEIVAIGGCEKHLSYIFGADCGELMDGLF